MNITGKILGGLFGALVLGPLGLILGVLIGHSFDRGIARGWQQGFTHSHNRTQQAFFNTTFLVMGHIAKADGRVSEPEIAMARRVMSHLGLNEEQKLEAMHLFNQGKQAEFDLIQQLQSFKNAGPVHPVLLKLFIEIQYQAAFADGYLAESKQTLLDQICHSLGVQVVNYGRQQQSYQNYGGNFQPFNQNHLADAYQTLGLKQGVSKAEVKKAYRKLMSQHHPDKLVSQGLPPEMMKAATEKTKEIQKAYELIQKQQQ